MKYPEFIAEMARPESRPKLRLSVASGYALALALAGLILIADAEGILVFETELVVLVSIKLLTNTLALLALRFDVLLLELHGINVIADAALITVAIHFTGGPVSPLFALYVIEVAVFGLLTNTGLTVLAATVCWLMYTGLGLLTYAGVVPQQPALDLDLWSATSLTISSVILAASTGYVTVLVFQLRRGQVLLEKQRDALVDANRQRSQFMTNVTHELRTPLHGIAGLAEMLALEVYGSMTPKQTDAADNIQRNARHLVDLIDDLLELARTDAGRLAFRPSEVEVEDLVTAVMAGARGMLETAGVEGSVRVEPGLPTIRTDRRKLSQILINLVGNGVKFTPAGGKVHISATLAGADAVAIAVHDTGIGIAADDLERIFSEFEQVDHRLERVYGGFGLGLPLVKRLAELLGAHVTVTSTVSKGSTFTVTVPVAYEPPQSEEPNAAPA